MDKLRRPGNEQRPCRGVRGAALAHYVRCDIDAPHSHTYTNNPPPSPSLTTRGHPAGRRTTSSWRAFGVRRQFGFGFGRAIFKPQEVRAAGLCQAVWLAFFCCSLMHVCVSQSVCFCVCVCDSVCNAFCSVTSGRLSPFL